MTIDIRTAQPQDIANIAKLEIAQWGKTNAASVPLIRQRLYNFPDGNYVAHNQQGVLLGYGAFMYVSPKMIEGEFTWDQITGNGTLSTHEPDGTILYGVNLTAQQTTEDKNVGEQIMKRGMEIIFEENKESFCLGSRAPGFTKWLRKNRGGTIGDYFEAHQASKNGLDPELSLYEKAGFKSVRCLPDYYPDEASGGHGVLVMWTNPEYIPPG